MSSCTPLTAECMELVRHYSRIADPISRRRWLDLIRAAAEREN